MKKRLDHLLVDKELAETRSKAQALIMTGAVYVDGVRRDKPGWQLDVNSDVYIQPKPRYVSRAGAKLASANEKFNVSFNNTVIMDVGSSTGGFTDYALQHGAATVYAIDVGKNQLHEKIRADNRVVVMEQTDIRDVSLRHSGLGSESKKQTSGFQSSGRRTNSQFLSEAPDIAVVDVSFISLQVVLPYVAQCTKKGGIIIAMCKPQFEAGVKDATKHKGVIKNDRLRRDILKKFEAWLKQNGFIVQDKADSEVYGAKGNRERFYLLAMAKR